MTDERKFPYLVDVQDGHPLVNFALRREFPKWVVTTKYNSFLKWKRVEWRCFISDVQCYATSGSQDERWWSKLDWALSVDHLVPKRLFGDDDRFHRIQNQFLIGRHLNRNLGHIPLALKLHHRSILRSKDYDRDDYTRPNFEMVKRFIIETEESLMYEGKFPWQPWTYTNTAHQRVAKAFMVEMAAVDEHFIEMSFQDRDSWIETFDWRW